MKLDEPKFDAVLLGNDRYVLLLSKYVDQLFPYGLNDPCVVLPYLVMAPSGAEELTTVELPFTVIVKAFVLVSINVAL